MRLVSSFAGRMTGRRSLSAFALGVGLIAALPAMAQLKPVNLQGSDKPDTVAIRITRFGPYPATVTRQAGPFLLFISNRSGVISDTYSLFLKPAVAVGPVVADVTSLLDLHSLVNKQRDYQMIDLLPGDYELRFQSHPEWVVSIKVTAN
jgi:hypothetical protein